MAPHVRRPRCGRRTAASAIRALRAQLPRSWNVFLIALLFAVSWQSFLTQTHQHSDSGSAARVAAANVKDAGPQRSSRQSPSDLPSNCPICREIAHASHFVLPAPIAMDLPAPLTFWVATVTSQVLALTQRSHTWQSRAPPHQLQA